ncbi:ATP-binding cassette domain-containing protein [Rhodoferax sp. WC2427]|uniref:ATP-binding cassette domain-containing protein n=1 Tax=Rhodoferax sp. WC2427 TaxID=3234144 RepID=UPI003467DA7B
MTTPPCASDTPLVLRACNISKSYGSKRALQAVNLCLRPGQFVALLGPNGAGKSTLLQILSGLFVADSGELSILGHDMHTQATRALACLGMVFQQSSLDLDLSVQANLLFHTDLHGIPRKTALHRISEGLERHGLQAQAKTAVRALSGGSRRKVELVRALLHKPRLLLMDEATVGLDPASRQALMGAVEHLARVEGVAILWATHLVDEVQQADQVVVLDQGAVVFDGQPKALVEQTQARNLEQAFLQLCPSLHAV